MVAQCTLSGICIPSRVVVQLRNWPGELMTDLRTSSRPAKINRRELAAREVITNVRAEIQHALAARSASPEGKRGEAATNQ